jgi:hypothetical protein
LYDNTTELNRRWRTFDDIIRENAFCEPGR